MANWPVAETTDPFLEQLNTMVEGHLDDPAFGIDELAAAVGVSRTNLHRKLKAVANMAPGEYIRNYRLKRATQFLRQGHRSAETAYLVGFDSPSYFSKCFRELYGLSPSDFADQEEKKARKG